MRRTVLLLLLTMMMLPVIGQDVTFSRNCRPRLDQIDQSRHTQRRASALNGTDSDKADNPLIGERRQLVVLAAFADKRFKGDSVQTLQPKDSRETVCRLCSSGIRY